MDLAKGKQADIAQHCIYEIATGKWSPGQKLPSVREAEKLWGVHRLTVLGAYRELEKIGLVVSKDRSGYYVAESSEEKALETDLMALYGKVKQLIARHSQLNPVYALRLFSAMAVSDSKTSPSYAFLECTDHQAADHASEIFQMFNIHVAPLCLPSAPGELPEVPASVKTLLTTGFHIREVMELGASLDLEVANVPIEVDPSGFDKAMFKVNKAIVVELESNMSSSIVQDIKAIAGEVTIEQKLVTDIEQGVSALLADQGNELILLSPRVWGRVSDAIKKDKRVKLIRFRISDTSWKNLSKVLNIPFPAR